MDDDAAALIACTGGVDDAGSALTDAHATHLARLRAANDKLEADYAARRAAIAERLARLDRENQLLRDELATLGRRRSRSCSPTTRPPPPPAPPRPAEDPVRQNPQDTSRLLERLLREAGYTADGDLRAPSRSSRSRRRRGKKKAPDPPVFDPRVPPPPLPALRLPVVRPPPRLPPGPFPPPPNPHDDFPLGASAASTATGAGRTLADPTLARYQHLLDKYQQVNPPNPFNDPENVRPGFYLDLPYPWNVAPAADADRLTDWKKVEGSAPRFDGREESYVAWRDLFIPAVHLARAKISFKANLLARALDTSKSARLLNIAAGIGATEEQYAATIERLEDQYGHPLGILGGRLRELEKIDNIRFNDYVTIHRLRMRLEDYLRELQRLGQHQEMVSHQLFETLYNKLDKRLGQDFLTWHNNNAAGYPPSPISIAAWLKVFTKNAQTHYRARQRLPQRRHPDVQFANFGEAADDPFDEPPPPLPDQLPTGASALALPARPEQPKCPFDGQVHRIVQCDKFKAMSPADRRRGLAKDDRCFGCFDKGHKVPKCPKSILCTLCQRGHHTLLHLPPRPTGNATIFMAGADDPGADSDDSIASQVVFNISSTPARGQSARISLHTVPLLCSNPRNGQKTRLNCMLDSGASATFISKRAAEALALTGYATIIHLKGVEGLSRRLEVVSTQLQVQLADGSWTRLFVQISQDPAASYVPVDWSTLKLQFPHLRQLPVPPPVPDQPVDILLGQDAAQLMSALEPDVCAVDNDGPVARRTPLGWSVGGSTQIPCSPQELASFFVFRQAVATTEHPPLFRGPWEARHLHNHPPPSKQEERPLSDAALTAATLRRLDEEEAPTAESLSFTDQLLFQNLQKEMKIVNGRYQVPVLWRQFPPPIKNNYGYALARLQALEKSKAFRDPSVRQEYISQIQDWLRSNFVEPVQSTSPHQDTAYYIPHMAVINMGKVSSKLRIVMDAAAAPHGRDSLNKHVHKGPKLINELIEVLLRFRRDRIAVAADIEKMFHKISMPPQDRDYHRFLWRENPKDPVRIYRWISHVFGNAGSPCVAISTVKTHAGARRLQFPLAADALIHSTLVDDSLVSLPDEDAALELLSQLRALLKEMGMNIKKVVSNSASVLASVPQEEISPSLSLQDFIPEPDALPVVKTLGVVYLAASDEYSFTLRTPESQHKWTKRTLLQFEARLYDPHGLLLPHTVAARILLQRAWRAALAWDDPLPPEILVQWQEWLGSLKVLPEIRVPRGIYPVDAPPVHKLALHVFADASDEACAAVAYIVTHYDSTRAPTSRLLLSKAKVAPLKKLTVPRLELVAATLAVSLVSCVSQTYSIPLADCHCWVDSVNVLCWIRNDSRALSTFVGNRVAKIQRATLIHNWKHVESHRNPADLPSRGALAASFVDNKLWWQGPGFLTGVEPPPALPSVVNAPQASQELKKGTQFAFTATDKLPPPSVLKDHYDVTSDLFPVRAADFSSFSRLVRVVAWCRRLAHPLPAPVLQTQEIREATRAVWSDVQHRCFARTIFDLQKSEQVSKESSLIKLHPAIFPDGLLRIRGRLSALPLTYQQRHPIILPKNHPAVLLLVVSEHKRLLHAGPEVLLANLMETYWIIQGRRLARHVVSHCVVCRRAAARPMLPKMAPLPQVRFPDDDARVFGRCGVDMAGPYFVRNPPDKFIHKRYFAIFTCLLSRAVHLEPLQSATVTSFLAAVERFAARRGGLPDYIVCDNGANIKATAKELKTLLEVPSHRRQIQEKLPHPQWDFIPPTGSHFGGIYERLIAAVKRALSAALPAEDPTTDELFLTNLTVVEGILNSRPLTYVSQHPRDPLPLTPADALGAGPYRSLAQEPQEWNLRKQWHANQVRLDRFWSRLRKEVIPFLQLTSKWHKDTRPPAVGDVVTMLDDQCRGAWPLAIITRLEVSSDGVVRVVHIRYRSGGRNKLCRRPLSSLCLLLPAEQ